MVAIVAAKVTGDARISDPIFWPGDYFSPVKKFGIPRKRLH